MILLNPGPVTLSARVRAALQREDLCHREPEFAQLTLDIRENLKLVYQDCATEYSPIILTGSGTAAVEAMLSTFASDNRPTLVVSNGVYGERMKSMLDQQKKPNVCINAPWGEPIDVAKVRGALDRNDSIACLAVVHHETTTGRLNRLEEVARLCRERGAGLLVDAVSSFGGEAFSFGDWSPLAVAGASNKCLHGAPGVSYVIARRESLETRPSFATTLYLDLHLYYAEQKNGWSPFTQSVQICQSLLEALTEFHEAGGWRSRHARYREISQRVRSELESLNVEGVLSAQESSVVLTAFRLPSRLSYEQVHDALKARGFVIYAGQGELRKTIFRIANMGAITDDDVTRLIEALRSVFKA